MVATVADRSVWSVVSILGAWSAGAAHVHLEPSDPEARIAALLTATGARAVLADARNRARLPERSAPVLLLDASLPTAPYELPEESEPQDTAYLVFTSGSTGVPKAVDVPHRAVLNHHFGFWRHMEPITTADSFGLTTTFAADLGLISVFGALLSGARLDIYDRHTTLDAGAFAAELGRHPVEALTYTPSSSKHWPDSRTSPRCCPPGWRSSRVRRSRPGWPPPCWKPAPTCSSSTVTGPPRRPSK
ncbi:AMP-binding protein [Streptomyces stramineus]